MLSAMGMIWEGRAVSAAQALELVRDRKSMWDLSDHDDADIVELDKAWHGIHLLTGEAYGGDGALADAIFGGEEFGEDEGFGPPRLLQPSSVAAVHTALSAVSDDVLRSRFDPQAMAGDEIYPDIWAETQVFDNYLLPNLTELRRLYAYAAERGLAVVHNIV